MAHERRSSLNIEDVDILNAERDADRERFRGIDPSDHFPTTFDRVHTERRQTEASRASRQQTQASRASQTTPAGEQVESPEDVQPDSASMSSLSTGRPDNSRTQSMATGYSSNLETQFMHYLDRHPTAVGRMEHHRMAHVATVGSRRSVSKPLPDFGGNKEYPPLLPDREEYVVEFSGHDDPRHAQNWPNKKKLLVCTIIVFSSLTSTFSSSIFSVTAADIERKFNVGREVATLTTSLYVLGYVFGPIIWGPMSELYGRKVPVIIGIFGFSIFNIAVAVAKDLQTIMISRFFAAVFGSCALALTPAIMADMYDNKTRGLAIAAFGASVMNGPFSAPFIGGFITKSYLGWRWTAYLPAIMGFGATIACVFFLEESYGPVILVSKAAELRRLTRNWGIHAKQEEVEVDLKELAVKNVSRPLRILFTEPIVLLVTLYMSFIYGLLYLSLTAFGIVFEEIHGFSLGVAGLPYMALVIGVMIAFAWVVYLNKSYVKKLEANNNIPVPEWRMPSVMVGSIAFTIGLFWFGWTGFTKSIPWIVPTVGASFIGFGMLLVFLQCLNYILDAYLMFAASASAANTMMRSMFGAIFPLFAAYMFDGIGIQWGMTFLGCMSALFVPMPFLFFFYGKKIRAKSKIAPAPDIAQDKRRDEESRGNSNDTDDSMEKKD